MLSSLYSGLRSIVYSQKSRFIRSITDISYVAGEGSYKIKTQLLPNNMLEAVRVGCPVPVVVDCSNSNLLQHVTYNSNLPECGSFTLRCGEVITEYFDPKNILPKLAGYLPSVETTVAVGALAVVTAGCYYAYSRMSASNDTTSTADITAAQRNTPN